MPHAKGILPRAILGTRAKA